jgi:hypothetical protein
LILLISIAALSLPTGFPKHIGVDRIVPVCRFKTAFEREALYAEVWREPVRTVARRYEVSDVALRKICKKLGVPVPPLSYWAKVAA